MTICISAICDTHKAKTRPKVVIASDRMLTSEALMIQFEQKQNKIWEIAHSCSVTLAGEALSPSDILRRAQSDIDKLTSPTIEQIAEKIKEELVIYRKKDVEEAIIIPRGFKDLDEYYEQMHRLPADLYQVIDDRITRFEKYEESMLEFLVAGVDYTGAHIYSVISPGRKLCYDSIGFDTVGSGDSHAFSVFTSYDYTSDLPLNDAIWIAYEAKKRAEKAPGVGRGTDMNIITEDGIETVDEKVLGQLDELYKKRLAQDSQWLKQIPQFQIGNIAKKEDDEKAV